MGLFSKRRDPGDRLAWVTSTMQRLLAERGVETTLAHDAELGPHLVATDGRTYLLENVAEQVAPLPDRAATRVLRDHVDRLTRAMASPATTSLTAEQLARQVRTRLLPVHTLQDGSITFDYARPFVDGVVEALCIDLPDAVTTVADQHLAELPATLDELYAWGRRNTMSESIDQRVEPRPGVRLCAGDSLFVTSKAVELDRVFGPAPGGRVFGMPHRHVLVAASIQGPDPIRVVEDTIRVIRAHIEDGAPGGIVSPHLFFQRDDAILRVSSFGEDDRFQVHLRAPFKEALDDASA